MTIRNSLVLIDGEIKELPSGDILAGTAFILTTTPKTQITNNKIELPSRPYGTVLHNIMLVYNSDGLIEYDEVSVEEINGTFYAVLNEQTTINGHGVVSYLARDGA
jgi:hypothetical protein